MLLCKKAIRAENCNHFQAVCLANCMHRGLCCIDWWLRRGLGGRGGVVVLWCWMGSWCRMRALYSEPLIKTNNSDPEPPFAWCCNKPFCFKWRVKKRCFLLKIITVQAELWCTASYHQTIVYIKLGQWIQVLLLYVSTSVGSLSGCLCFVYAIIFPWGNCGSWKWSGSSKLFPMALPSVYECTVCMNGWA